MRSLTVEQMMIWAYRDQMVDRDEVQVARFERGLSGPGISTDGVMAMVRYGEIGARVDGGGQRGGSITHPLADLLEELTERAPDGVVRQQLIVNARTGSRPDWKPGTRPSYEPIRSLSGKREVDWTEWGDCYCPVVLVDSWATVIESRLCWERWVYGLTFVAARLGAEMHLFDDFVLEPGLPPLSPWKSEPLSLRVPYEEHLSAWKKRRKRP